MSSWFDKILPKSFDGSKHLIPDGIWTKCDKCEERLDKDELRRNLMVCPKCGYHMRLKARERIRAFLDEEGIEEIAQDLEPKDVLKFKDLKRYKDRLAAAQKASGEKDALVVCKGTVLGIPVVCCAFEFAFMGGSMSAVVGARFCRGVSLARQEGRALVCFSASGGARMQESLLALFQMAKTSAALGRLAVAGLPFISVMTDPTMGGVTASLAMLGDVNIAEPGALIGFAGPRVIEQTTRKPLPKGSYYTQFEINLNNGVENPSKGYKGVMCRKEFRIE